MSENRGDVLLKSGHIKVAEVLTKQIRACVSSSHLRSYVLTGGITTTTIVTNDIASKLAD
jgi:hypothetical protein